MADPTHKLVKKPQMSLRDLADYMACSAQAKRTLLKACKYRKIARVIQHKEAKAVIGNWLVDGGGDPAKLTAKADAISRRMFADPFEEKVGKYNADYIKRFAEVYEPAILGGFTIERAGEMPATVVNGTRVTFEPAVFLTRVNKVNALKIGVAMLRYLKGEPADPVACEHQSAFMFAHLAAQPFIENGESERAMCITYDSHTGTKHTAPTKAIYFYNEMVANCGTIADAWDNIKPPPGAIIA